MAKKIKVDKENLKKVRGKGKGLMGEFKEFVLRGNVMDMAIGVIIGTAFAGIVTSLTTNIINPLINGIMTAGKKKEEKTPEIVKSDEVKLLEEIRDLLKKQK